MVVEEYGVVGRGGEEGDVMRYPKKEVAEVATIPFSIFLAYPHATRDGRCKRQAAHDARGAPTSASPLSPWRVMRGRSCILSRHVARSAHDRGSNDADAHQARRGRAHIQTSSPPRPRPRGDAQVYLACATTRCPSRATSPSSCLPVHDEHQARVDRDSGGQA
ncbi:hypothetical protein B0H14DRAFT_2875673 [Mycena olivaceomarginata]|nr:hypothetical protein B0H14DRAFT_2875673 [Mycena olivaceomarginata]